MQRAKKKRQQKQRSQRYTFIGIALFIIGIGLLVWMAMQPGSSQSAMPAVMEQGKPAPDFTTQALFGSTASLTDYAGDVVVVNFWATWCPPCKAEMPGINAFYERHQADGLVVLAVNAKESESLVRPFIESNQFTFPVLLDPAGSIINQYQVRSFPTTVIIDRDGVVRHIQVGMISEEELETAVAPLL